MKSVVFPAVLAAALAAALVIATSASAARGNCGQPVTNGNNPTASDCLFILRTAVGTQTCDPACVCDTNGSGTTTASDALVCLKRAVGQDVALACSCGGETTTTVAGNTTTTLVDNTTTTVEDGTTTTTVANGTTTTTLQSGTTTTTVAAATTTTLEVTTDAPCSSVEMRGRGGSLSVGWSGSAHGGVVFPNTRVTAAFVRRCTSSSGTRSNVCADDAACGNGETCEVACDCDDPEDSVCELAGPTHERRCSTNQTSCTSNADCAQGAGTCVHFLMPPTPTNTSGAALCLTAYFASDLAGTFDVASGNAEVFARFKVNMFVGSTEAPCPVCDTGSSLDREVGDTGTCVGGTREGESCTVDAVHDAYGATSFDCPPSPGSFFNGPTFAWQPLTTGEGSKTAQLECKGFGFRPGDTGGRICLDTIGGTPARCTSNADCLRCTSDLAPCANNGDCTSGTCAAAPAQPIACGFYCHVGYCKPDAGVLDATRLCMENGDCEPGETCVEGSGGSSTSPGAPQTQPNGCSKGVCGTEAPGECPAPDVVHTCDGPMGSSCFTNGDCESFDDGQVCESNPEPCFQHTIPATGVASAVGRYCVSSDPPIPCASSTDCGGTACRPDSAAPTFTAAVALSGSASSVVNTAVGLPGPGVLELPQVALLCRCGDGSRGCDEQCDDGNGNNGDGCSRFCTTEP